MYSIDELYELYKNNLEKGEYKQITFNGPNVSSSNTMFDNIFATKKSILENVDEKFEDWITYRYALLINDNRYKGILDIVFDINLEINNEVITNAWKNINIGEYTLENKEK